MKKQILFLFATLSTLFITLTSSAQGEWKWANYWSGTDGGGAYNEIVQTAFDENGNIYVFGQIGGNPTLNGQPLQFTSHPLALSLNKATIMLAKFDSLGNMLWYKIVKSSEQVHCLPHWMEVKDNKVYISGNMSLDYVDYSATVNNVWLYYFDTLITGPQVHEIPVEQRRPPYKTGRYTYFATFDLDGNLLDNHFVETRTRKIYANGVRGEYGLVKNDILAPFHVDGEGNTYVFTKIQYAGSVNDPYTIIVDSDTNRTYDVYLPGDVAPSYGYPLDNGMMYKFSPDWELLYARPMVDHTEGIATSHELAQDSINPHYYIHIGGLSFDEDDNMYFTGYLELGLSGGFGDTLHQYPVHIYWDSTHYCSMLDVTSARMMGFVVKYDTGGTVQWCNQTFTRGVNQFSAYAGFTGVKVYDGSVYVNGQGGVIHEEQNGLVYFDDESHPLQRYQQSRSNQTFFVRYDAQTGNYLNQGVAPCIDAMCGSFLTVINNRVFAYANPLYVQKICQWTNNGEFIDTINFNTYEDRYPSVLANDQGRLIFHSSVTGPAAFSNSVSANCPGRSSAIFALYYDPSFAEPYVGIPDYEETLSNVRIWPNPTNNILYVESDNVPIDYITIMDLNGRILMKENVGDNSFVMNASCLPAGTYLLETVCKGERSVVKFVKVDD